MTEKPRDIYELGAGRKGAGHLLSPRKAIFAAVRAAQTDPNYAGVFTAADIELGKKLENDIAEKNWEPFLQSGPLALSIPTRHRVSLAVEWFNDGNSVDQQIVGILLPDEADVLKTLESPNSLRHRGAERLVAAVIGDEHYPVNDAFLEMHCPGIRREVRTLTPTRAASA